MIARYLGHASFEIFFGSEEKTTKILTDPFYYPRFPGHKRLYDPIKPVDIYDYILISHDHFDHCDVRLVDELYSERTKIITTAEASSKIRHPCIVLEEGQVFSDDVLIVNAVHAEHPQSEGPVGFWLEFVETGEAVYFAGDTYLYQEIGDIRTHILAILPVGGKYTMDIEEAASAVSLLRPEHVIPMHYNTWDIIAVDVSEFASALKEKTVGVKLHVLEPGAQIVI